LTVKENLLVLARVKGVTKKEFQNNIKIILQNLEMSEFEDTLAFNLSLGDKRKLSFAMTLIV
jgi:ABC-type multidrug transport system ATPase subunit